MSTARLPRYSVAPSFIRRAVSSAWWMTCPFNDWCREKGARDVTRMQKAKDTLP
jgi:hypothetical protein